jgi:hypothetical protein
LDQNLDDQNVFQTKLGFSIIYYADKSHLWLKTLFWWKNLQM